MMIEIPKTDDESDDGFDDDLMLGAPPAMPDEVWESSLAAAFNPADVDESLYPDDITLAADDREAGPLQSLDNDIAPSGFYGGQEPERPENWNDDDDRY